MTWAGANYPQEYDSDAVNCGHAGAMYFIRDDDGVASVSCVDCIASEIETLRQGVAVQWSIQRLTDDPEPCLVKLVGGPCIGPEGHDGPHLVR